MKESLTGGNTIPLLLSNLGLVYIASTISSPNTSLACDVILTLYLISEYPCREVHVQCRDVVFSRMGRRTLLRPRKFSWYHIVLGFLQHLKTTRCLELESQLANIYMSKTFSTHVCIYTKDEQNVFNCTRTANYIFNLACTQSPTYCLLALYSIPMSQLFILATRYPDLRFPIVCLLPPQYLWTCSLKIKALYASDAVGSIAFSPSDWWYSNLVVMTIRQGFNREIASLALASVYQCHFLEQSRRPKHSSQAQYRQNIWRPTTSHTLGTHIWSLFVHGGRQRHSLWEVL